MNTIWQLRHNTEDFKYLGLHNEKTGRFPRHDGTPELETWEPQYVRYSVWDTNEDKKNANFPSWSGNLVCDLEAKEKLQELIGIETGRLQVMMCRGLQSYPYDYFSSL